MWQIGHSRHLRSLELLLYTSCFSKFSLATYIKEQTIYSRMTCILCHVEKLTPHFFGITNKFLTNPSVLPPLDVKERMVLEQYPMHVLNHCCWHADPPIHVWHFWLSKIITSSLSKSSCVKLNTSATYIFTLNQYVNKAIKGATN
jgi:hypothetical protein